MTSRRISPESMHVYDRIKASGLDLTSTRRRVLYYLEGVLAQVGPEGLDRLMGILVPLSRQQRNAEAWFNWATTKPWVTLVPDDQIRFVYNGPADTGTRIGGMDSMTDLLGPALS